MNRKEFVKEVVQERLDKITSVLASKADEYATDGSAFYNFERAGKVNNESTEEALWGMATKHLVSVIDMVESDETFDHEYIDEKIGDMINYLILLEGILKENKSHVF